MNLEAFVQCLQGAYSEQLYGERNRVPENVQMLWTSLLPAEAHEVLKRSVMMQMDGNATHPFYWCYDMRFNPRHTLYIHRDQPRYTPFANDTWYEASHCRNPAPAGYGGGMLSAFWTYAVPGSGVFMNTGRTTRAKSYKHAVAIMHNEFREKSSSDYYQRTFDTIQITNHVEWHSRSALRHEIIHLHRQEQHTLADVPTRCGASHMLVPCSPSVYARFEHCAPGRYSPSRPGLARPP